MVSMYRRKTLLRRLYLFCDDCLWSIQKNFKAFVGGFMLGALSMVIVSEIVWGL